MSGKREPIFNAPRVVTALIAAFVALQMVREFISERSELELLLRFAFIPARYDAGSRFVDNWPGGAGAEVWTFVSYAFLHGSWTHLIVNAVMMLAFGSALAWRFGAPRFLLFSGLTAAAGAAAHLALHIGSMTPVVGASAAISAHMAGAMRFVFEAGGPLGAFRANGADAFRVPAEPLSKAIRRPQLLIFLGVWFAANLLFGLGGAALLGEEADVAWEAHIGGFLAGLALFPLLDPVRSRDVSGSHPSEDR